MTFQRRILPLCALVAILALPGCSDAGERATNGASADGGPAFESVEPDAIAIGVVAGGEALPLLVADDSDLFKAANVEARIVRFDTADARDAALAAGEIDAYVGDIGSAAALEAAGTPVAIVSVVADAALALESTATPVPEGDSAAYGLGEATAYLVVADHYLALPSGLLATRAVLEAVDSAVVRIQGDPTAYQGALAEAAGRDEVVVAGRAYPASVSPGAAEVERQLLELAATRPRTTGMTYEDLVLDIGR